MFKRRGGEGGLGIVHDFSNLAVFHNLFSHRLSVNVGHEVKTIWRQKVGDVENLGNAEHLRCWWDLVAIGVSTRVQKVVRNWK